MPVRFTNEALKSLRIPAGKKKVSIADVEQRGLTFDLHSSGGYFQFRYSVNGKQRSISIGQFGPLTVKDARKRASEFARNVALGADPQETKREKRQSPTYAEFVLENYLPFVRANKRSYSTDVSVMKNHLLPAFGSQKMMHITKPQVIKFLQEKYSTGLAPSTVNRLLVLLRYSFNLALDWELPGITSNPAHKVKPFKENNKIERYLSDDEALRLKAALIQSPNQMLPIIVAFLLVTGARKGEALGAKWDQFDLEKGIWRIPLSKSGTARYVPLSSVAINVLDLSRSLVNQLMRAKLIKSCPWVFPNPETGKPFVSIFRSWNTCRRKAGLETVRVHDLRHTFASTLVNSGVPIYEVQKILGHQNLLTTERYSHLAPRRLQDSAGVAGQRFGNLWNLSGKVNTIFSEEILPELPP